MAMMRYQPQGLLRIDQGNPLAVGLRLAVLPGVNRVFDAARRAAVTPVGVNRVGTPAGLSGGFGSTYGTGTAVDKIATNLSGAIPAAGRSYYFRAMRNGAGGGSLGRLFDKTNGSTGQFFYWYAGGTSLGYGFFAGGSERYCGIPVAGQVIGEWFDVYVSHAFDGTTHTINAWVNGTQVVTNFTLAASNTDAASTPFTIGNRNSDNIRSWDGLIECAYIWDGIPAGGAAALKANRYALFTDGIEDDEPVAVAGGATDTPVDPGTGAFTLTGYAPTIGQSANQTTTLAAGSLAVTGYAPAVTQSAAQGIALQPASLTVAGYAPTVGQTANVSLAPSPAGLNVTGYAPSVSVVAPQPVSVPLDLSTLSITGYAPTIYQGAAQQPIVDGGGAGGSVREVRKFADLLDKAHVKPSRSQKKARRRQLEAEALELLPDLPEAEMIAPIAARIVYEQEARALAPLYADRPAEALSPVFDTHAALRELLDKLLAEALLQQKVAEDEENDVELLLFGT